MKSDFSAFVNPNKKVKKEYEVKQTDAFDSFLATLSEQLGNLKKINQDIFEENLIYSQPEKLHTKTNTSVDTKKYLNFLEDNTKDYKLSTRRKQRYHKHIFSNK
jgi:hypothetical protein